MVIGESILMCAVAVSVAGGCLWFLAASNAFLEAPEPVYVSFNRFGPRYAHAAVTAYSRRPKQEAGTYG